MRLLNLTFVIALLITMASAHTVTCFKERPKQGTQESVKKSIEWFEEEHPYTDPEFHDMIEWLSSGHSSSDTSAPPKEVIIGAEACTCKQLYCHVMDDIETAIWFCNDDWRELKKMTMEHVLEAIHVIMHDCDKLSSQEDHYWMGGEILHDDLWRLKIQRIKEGQRCFKNWASPGYPG